MKKIMAGIITAAIVATMGTVSVMALPRQSGQNMNATASGSCMNDSGNCDGYGNRMNFVDVDGDGICDGCTNGQGCTDTDGDGVCDRRAADRALRMRTATASVTMAPGRIRRTEPG